MRTTRPLLLLAFLTAAGSGGESIEWRTDLAAARAEAAKSGRPMLIVFR